MLKRKRKIHHKKENDVLNLDQYFYDPLVNANDITKKSTSLPPEKKQHAQEYLDRLIQQDAAAVRFSPPAEPVQKTLPETVAHTGQEKTRFASELPAARERSLPKGSQYIIDLRKQYLIEKHNLHTLQKPQESLWQRAGRYFAASSRPPRIEWHYPERKKVTERHAGPGSLFVSNQPTLSATPEPAEVSLAEEPVVILPPAAEEAAILENQPIPWRMRVASVAVYCVVLFCMVMLVPVVQMVGRFSTDGVALWGKGLFAVSKLQAGVRDLSSREYLQAEQTLSEARDNFSDINKTLDQYLAAVGSVIPMVPSVNSKIVLARSMSSIGEHSAAIGIIFSRSLTHPEGRPLTDTLADLRGHLEAMDGALDEAHDDIMRVSPDQLPYEFRSQFIEVQGNLPRTRAALRQAISMLTVTEHIIGAKELSRYLIVFQNSRELRPTGGFMGSFALVDFSKGIPLALEFPGGGTYDVEGGFKQSIIPPKPISILNDEWHMWDSNWWPDFPTSAEKIAWFYQQAGGRTVDGVIAVNSSYLVDLLRVVGPIPMPEYGITVDADSFYTVIQREVEQEYDPSLNQPKKVLKDLMPLLLERLLQESNYGEVLTTTMRSLASRDIQIAILNDDAIARSVKDLRWDGSQLPYDADYLSVVSTNSAGGKSDEAIFQTIDHRASIADTGEITVTVSVTKEHRGDPSDMFSYVNNVDYLRFYVPLGSTLISAEGFQEPASSLFKEPTDLQVPDEDLLRVSGPVTIDQKTGTTIGKELSYTVFGNWMQVQPGGTTKVTISYTLPFSIAIPETSGVKWFSLWDKRSQEVDSYSALFQMQSGKKNTILNSTVTIDPRYHIVWSDSLQPDATGVSEQTLEYSGAYTKDMYYALLLARHADIARP